MIHDSILDCIGKTPIVRLNKIPIEEEIQCELCKQYSEELHFIFSCKMRIL